ncbi:hypothetical protein JHK85_004890 [Glycine max]|nr:hypothetical protein JHK85_004890 [Glycine max]
MHNCFNCLFTQILGKASGGGVIPVSAVLADKDVMLCIQPGQHGSTFGGNPMASAVAIGSVEVIKNEGLVKRYQMHCQILYCQYILIIMHT